MPERREIHGGYDSRGRDGIINRNYGAAGLAATEKRLVILIQSQVPQDHALRPIPGCGDDQANLLLKQSSFLPLAAGTFRKPNVLVGKTVVEFGLRRGTAAVAVNGDAWNESRCLSVAQYSDRKIDQIPTMVEREDLGFDACGAEGWSQIVANKLCLLIRGHTHPGIVIGNVEGLVLRGYSKDGNVGSLIGLDVAHKIFGKGSVC